MQIRREAEVKREAEVDGDEKEVQSRCRLEGRASG